MNNNKNFLIGAGVIVIILIIAAYFAGRASVSSPAWPQNSQISTSTSMLATTTNATTTAQGVSASGGTSAPHVTSTVSPAHPMIPPGTQTLHVGQSVTTASGVTISIISVSDNRCPIGVTCTEAGTVSANIKIQNGTFVQSQILTLGVPTTEYGFTAELISASPDKVKGQAIPQSAYALVFMVR